MTLLPLLLTIAKNESMYRRGVWRCRCKDGGCTADPSAADLPGGSWSHCPYSLLRGPQMSVLLALDKCATISPLSGWPDAYPAWLAWGLIVLQQRRGTK